MELICDGGLFLEFISNFCCLVMGAYLNGAFCGDNFRTQGISFSHW